MEIDSNFESDWNQLIRRELNNHFTPSAIPTDDREAEILYFNYLHRSIRIRPRNVIGESNISVPSHLATGFNLLIQKVKAGDNLNPNLSTRRTDLTYNDGMLNEWGVFHFHLGSNIKSNGYIERTGELLFALVDPNNFYCIDIFDHLSWTDLDVVKKIHQKFPQTIESNKIEGAVGLSHNVTSADVEKLRDAGINTMLEMDDGTIYSPPGGGFMGDGTSLKAVLYSDRWRKDLRSFEDNLENVINQFLSDVTFSSSPIRCSLIKQQNKLAIHFDEPDLDLPIDVEFPAI